MHVYLSQHNSASASLLQRKSGKLKLYSLMSARHVKYLFPYTPVLARFLRRTPIPPDKSQSDREIPAPSCPPAESKARQETYDSWLRKSHSSLAETAASAIRQRSTLRIPA